MSPRGPYAKGVAKREEILRTALAVFAKNGYLKTSIRDLADAANLSQAGLLHYFGSKEELLVAILAHREETNSRARGDKELLASFFDVIHRNVDDPGLAQLFATMSTAASDETHPAHDFFVTRYADLRANLGAALRVRQAEGQLDSAIDADRLATILIAVADGLQVQWLTDDAVDMPATLDYLWSLIVSSRPTE
ncbi:MAG: TetR/AcrR family transcriptional regulator [Lacisediminihabitans sp.]